MFASLDLPAISFAILGLFIIGVFIYQMWSKKGQRQTIEMITGLKVVGDPIDLPSNDFSPKFGIRIHQELRVYCCTGADKNVFVLEITQKSLGGISRTFAMLSSESIDQLNNIKNKDLISQHQQ